MSWKDEVKKSPVIVKNVSKALRKSLMAIRTQEKNLLYMANELEAYSSSDNAKTNLAKSLKSKFATNLEKLQMISKEMQDIEKELIALTR